MSQNEPAAIVTFRDWIVNQVKEDAVDKEEYQVYSICDNDIQEVESINSTK